MKTSLIIPVYNEADYIPMLVQAIRNSSIKPDEILFCDNNSTDDSIRVIQQTCNGLPYIILKEPKKGIIHTVERLWRAAKGDIILKVDADSVIPPNWIKNVLKHFTENPELAASTGPILSSDGNIALQILINCAYVLGIPIYVLMNRCLPLYGPNSAFRKCNLEQVNGYISETIGLDDQIISKKMANTKLPIYWKIDMYNYHSTRRFQKRPLALIEAILSLIHPRYYNEKQ